MFLDQELKTIQESKNRLAICCDLRRRLVHIEVRGIWCRGAQFGFDSDLGVGRSRGDSRFSA